MIAPTRTDDVPTFVVEAVGPRRAVLVFRVGRTDEPLPWTGITHLVEHLALLPFREQPYQYGGQVEGIRTVFWVQGSDADIIEFFRRLCENLASLPLERLADEARLLETEARTRKTTALESLLGIRYGAAGWGTLGFPEYALDHPDADRVSAWAGQYFTAQNAAVGLSGPIDGSLALPLPTGSRVPPPVVTPLASTRTPAWIHESHPGVGLGFVGQRSIQFAGLMRVLERHGRARLRFGESLSYEVAANTLRLTDQLTHGVVWADGLPENMSKVWTGLLAVIDEVMKSGPSETELREDIEAFRKSIQDPGYPLAVLDRVLTNELFGTPTESGEELIAEMERMSPADYQTLLREVFPTAVAAVPNHVAVLDSRFTPVPIWSTEATQGREYRLGSPRTPVQGQTTLLTVGDTGATLRVGAGQFVTVPYAECEAMLTWDEGSRTLISRDSFRLHIRPADWTNGQEITPALDQRVPKELAVPMGPRPNPDPDALSGPPTKAQPPRKGRWPLTWSQMAVLIGLIVAYMVVRLFVLNR